MNGLVYTVRFENETIAVADGNMDLFELSPADDRPIEIMGWDLTVTSEVGDSAEEILRLEVIKGHATGGSGGNTGVARNGTNHGGTAGFTAETVNDVVASTGSPVSVWSGGMNVRIPYQVWFPEGCEIGAVQADTTIVLRLMAAVADDLVMNGTIFVREKL